MGRPHNAGPASLPERRRGEVGRPRLCREGDEGRRPGLRAAGRTHRANLDRYQIVKGWLDKNGNLHEKIYDVAWSGDRKPGGDGKFRSVGSTVDVENATWTNTISAPELIKVWKDPEFDPSLPALYCDRVIEIPTPRRTAYDAKRYGVDSLPGTAMTITERAYTSPIWYTPLTLRGVSIHPFPDLLPTKQEGLAWVRSRHATLATE